MQSNDGKPVEKITMKKEQLEAMKAANEKADQIFNDPAQKDGRDSADGVLIEERLFVKFVNSEIPQIPGGDTDGPMNIFDVLINKWTITFYKESVTNYPLIKGILQGN